jgi:broad specificity phosphatase PhoE
MDTVFHLIRHARHDQVHTVLVGRMPGVGLSEAGRAEAADLAETLAHRPIALLQTSPRRRARETAAIIGERLGLPVQIVRALDELDVGAWSGMSFEALADDPAWQRWNASRSRARPPSGESMEDVLRRLRTHMACLQRQHPGKEIALVSHAEPIRTVVLHRRGWSFDDFARVEIAPASVTTLAGIEAKLQETVAT